MLGNLGAHKGGRVRKLIKGRGCKLLFLPPCSLDLNPIEEAFSKVKGLLRRAGARTREALIEAMGRALDAVTTQDTRGFFEHCGYLLPVQPLLQPFYFTCLYSTGIIRSICNRSRWGRTWTIRTQVLDKSSKKQETTAIILQGLILQPLAVF